MKPEIKAVNHPVYSTGVITVISIGIETDIAIAFREKHH
jgi:hypothetical protein